MLSVARWALRARVAKVAALRAAGLPSVPLMLSEEKATNPFLRCAEPAVIAAAEKQNAAVDRKKAAIFKVIRHWRNDF